MAASNGNSIAAIVMGAILLLGAFAAFSEASELQEKHDKFCGGLLEALLDWNGDCEDLRGYIQFLETVAFVCGLLGIISLVGGASSMNNSNKQQAIQFPYGVQMAPASTPPIQSGFNPQSWAHDNVSKLATIVFPEIGGSTWTINNVHVHDLEFSIVAIPNPSLEFQMVEFNLKVEGVNINLISTRIKEGESWRAYS